MLSPMCVRGLFVAACLSGSGAALGTVELYTSETDWRAALSSTECWSFDANSVLAANEVATLPSNGTSLGSILTFEAANTGLQVDFTVEALQAGYSFHFQDDAHPDSPFLDIAGGENDDWEVTIVSGATVFALGATIADHEAGTASGETLHVYGVGGVLLDSLTIPSEPAGALFIGIVSTEAITSVVHDEGDSDSDNIGLAEVCFGGPPRIPTVGNMGLAALTVLLLLAAGAVITRRPVGS